MKITLLVAGKTKVNYLGEGMNEYIRRIGHYAPLRIEILPDVKAGKKTSPDMVKMLEGEKFLKFIKPSDYAILLDERGNNFSSKAFANKLASLEGRTGHVVFVIGGAYGFSEDLYGRADEKLSLSDMTFSHQMVRLIFLEQLYRAFTILKGEPYHHN